MKKFIAILALLTSTLAMAAGGPALLFDGYGNPISSTTGALNVSGSLTASNPSIGTTGAAVPGSETYVGGSKAGLLTGLLIGQQTMANSLACVLPSDQSAIPVTGTFWQATQPISAASLPLPTGAATAAKQPALGTAGVASTDVLTVQGIASMTPLKVDGSGVTQPVSGTVTANIGTSGSLALDASVTGLQVAQGSATLGEKGSLVLGAVSTAAPAYTTAQSSPLSLTTSGALRVDNSAVTQPVSGTVTANQGGAPWSQNITQFGGSSVVTGTGTSGFGIPRVTVSSDSSINVTQSGPAWNVKINDTNGLAIAEGQKTMSASLPVVIASDQTTVPTQPHINANGSGNIAAATVGTTVSVLSTPSNSVGFILQNLDTSTANIRWAIGRTASATVGQQLQPGRDTGFIPSAGTVSVISEGGTQNYDIQWVIQ